MRLFIAVAPDDAARRALSRAAAALREAVPARYADESLYHLTLAFLGETDAADAQRAADAMRACAVCARPFAVPFAGYGRFGGVLYLGLSGHEALAQLAVSLRAALGAAGIRTDPKPFRAHITLARDAQPARLPEARATDAVFSVSSMTLFESARVNGVLCYLPRARADLG